MQPRGSVQPFANNDLFYPPALNLSAQLVCVYNFVLKMYLDFNIYDSYCVIFIMCHFPSFQYLDIFCNNYVFVL